MRATKIYKNQRSRITTIIVNLIVNKCQLKDYIVSEYEWSIYFVYLYRLVCIYFRSNKFGLNIYILSSFVSACSSYYHSSYPHIFVGILDAVFLFNKNIRSIRR